MSESGPAPERRAALHSAPPRLTCCFVVRRGAPRGRIWLRVEGSGVEWGALVGPGGAHRPGGQRRANAAKGRGVGPMFLGTHTPRLDDKGRLILPAKFRDELAGVS
ncbi:hypothetical protein GCM10029963_67700 [Micromonospora andamanensis]